MDDVLRQRLYEFAKQCGLSTQALAGVCHCGGYFAVDLDPAGVFHSLPMCKEFKEKEPDEFLAYFNRTALN